MLKVFYNKFYKCGYTEFSKLNQDIRQTFKKTLMAKEIYMGSSDSYVNQHLANFIIDKQFLV